MTTNGNPALVNLPFLNANAALQAHCDSHVREAAPVALIGEGFAPLDRLRADSEAMIDAFPLSMIAPGRER